MFISDSHPEAGPVDAACPVVVLVPGLGCDHTMYAPQVAALAGEFRVLAERGIDAAHLVGISYGGVLVETFCLRHPDRAASAVVCDSLCDTRPRSFGDRLNLAPAKLQPALIRLLPKSWLAASVGPAYRRWPLAGAAMRAAFRNARTEDLVKQRRVVNAVELADDLATATQPTLCLVGDKPPFAVRMMRQVADVLPHAEFALIHDSMDPSNLCQPEEVNRLVGDWVRRQAA